MAKPKYQDQHKNQTARIFARAFGRLAAELKLSTKILGVDLAKEGFDWSDKAAYGYQNAFPRPQIYYVLQHDKAQATRDPKTGRFEQRNRYGEYLSAQSTFPLNLGSKDKDEYSKSIVWCEGDSRASDRDIKAKQLNCNENAKITAKLKWLFKDLNKLIEAIKEVVKKNKAVDKFNIYCLQAALDEAENNLQSYKYTLGAQYAYNSRDLETLYSISPIVRWFFEVAPRIAPTSFREKSRLLSFLAKSKAQDKKAVEDLPWFCDVDTTPNAIKPNIRKGMFMLDWDTLSASTASSPKSPTSTSPKVETRTKSAQPDTREKTAAMLDRSSSLSTTYVGAGVTGVVVLGGLIWWWLAKQSKL